ncbi:MAG: DUF4105 domain-containing protein [Kiritimatiellae bacterium]|nr:DUF4105 domain-containing protein [Kiritimatiellia bacterium]
MRFAIVYIAFSLLSLAPIHALADDFGNDGIDRSDPNFVTASLLIMSPGDELYSCAGHSCIRLECPKFNLDYCFSYESESVKDKIFTFFMGKLKMGMFAIPTAKWLNTYEKIGRGITQYRLNLPPAAKQRLWKLLDEKVAEGSNLPYEYLERGCAQAVLSILRKASASQGSSGLVVPSEWVPVREGLPLSRPFTRRKCVDTFTSAPHPWNCFFLHAICGAELDREVPISKSIVVPSDLPSLLRASTIDGKPIIDSDGVELLPVNQGGTRSRATAIFTPLVVACVIAAFATTNWFVKVKWLDWLFLAFQSLAGAFFTYLVAFSNLPATDWNWLIVPFNLLPLVFWKWRQKWALWFAGVLVLWEIWMIAAPHRLTDPAYLVLVVAYVLMYARLGWKWHCAATERHTAEQFTGRAVAPRPPHKGNHLEREEGRKTR